MYYYYGKSNSHMFTFLVINSPAAKGGGGNPKISDIVFSCGLFIIGGVYIENYGGVVLSPLSNFKYSRWRPKWLTQ